MRIKSWSGNKRKSSGEGLPEHQTQPLCVFILILSKTAFLRFACSTEYFSSSLLNYKNYLRLIFYHKCCKYFFLMEFNFLFCLFSIQKFVILSSHFCLLFYVWLSEGNKCRWVQILEPRGLGWRGQPQH